MSTLELRSNIDELYTEIKERLLAIDGDLENHFGWMSESLYDSDFNGGDEQIISNAIDNLKSGMHVSRDEYTSILATAALIDIYNTPKCRNTLATIILESCDVEYINKLHTHWNEIARITIGEHEEEIDCYLCQEQYCFSDAERSYIMDKLNKDVDVLMANDHYIAGGCYDSFILQLDTAVFVEKMRQHFNLK